MTPRRLLVTLIALLVSACVLIPGPPATDRPASVAQSLPLCDEVPYLEAPAEYYRERPIYVANEMEEEIQQIQAWAATKLGFEGLWIDRRHVGWITLAFSVDAEARQADLRREFPDVGVVAVQVDWTRHELEALQGRVVEVLRGQQIAFGSGIFENKGVVSAGINFLKPDWVSLLEEHFAGERLCLEGEDPALAPVEGPQPLEGEGWRLLADQDETGDSYRTGIAFDETSYAELWRRARLAGGPPAVDFESEVVIWFGAVHGSSCPRIRLDGVVTDHGARLVYSDITHLDVGICTLDAISHAYVVAFQRSQLPAGQFAIQLGPEDPPAGVPEERTVVDADLSRPGSIAGPGEVHGSPSLPEPLYVGPGDIIEVGFPWQYRQSTHCGLEWLGPLNEAAWRTEVPGGAADWIPRQWVRVVVDQTIELRIVLETEPEPVIRAAANGHEVLYRPTMEAPPGCD